MGSVTEVIAILDGKSGSKKHVSSAPLLPCRYTHGKVNYTEDGQTYREFLPCGFGRHSCFRTGRIDGVLDVGNCFFDGQGHLFFSGSEGVFTLFAFMKQDGDCRVTTHLLSHTRHTRQKRVEAHSTGTVIRASPLVGFPCI